MNDGIKFIFKNFELEKKKNFDEDERQQKHIKFLINQLTLNNPLTALQYELLINFLIHQQVIQRKYEIEESTVGISESLRTRHLNENIFNVKQITKRQNWKSRWQERSDSKANLKSIKAMLMADQKVQNVLIDVRKSMLKMKKVKLISNS